MTSVLNYINDILFTRVPPKPSKEVERLIVQLGLSLREISSIYSFFLSLRRVKSETKLIVSDEISVDSMFTIITSRREYVESLLKSLIELGGCYETIPWDSFLYINLRYCGLSRIELGQTMFYIIVKQIKSWTVHYLSSSQLEEFYFRFKDCDVDSFSSRDISFGRLPLTRYYIADFVELCLRFPVLLNPLVHLQKCLQRKLPSLNFWDNYDRADIPMQKVTLDFFHSKKTHIFFQGLSNFTQTADNTIQQVLGVQNHKQIPLDRLQESTTAYSADPSILEAMPPGGTVPRWMREYISVPVKQSFAERAQEIEFIAKSRETRPRERSLLVDMEQKHQMPLLERIQP